MENGFSKKKLLLILSFIPHAVILLFGLWCMITCDEFLGSSISPLESFWLGIVLLVSQYIVVFVPLLIISLVIHIGLIVDKINSRRDRKINVKKLVIILASIAGVVSALFIFWHVYYYEIMVVKRNIQANIYYKFADEKKTVLNEKWDNLGLFCNDDITRNTMMIDWDSNRFTMVTDYDVESFELKTIDADEIERIKSNMLKIEEKTLNFNDGSVVTLYCEYSTVDLITITKPDGSVLGRELHTGHLPDYYLHEKDFE